MKICLLTYRGNPFCGGQGVYVSHLARELARQGHEVHCISGPPHLEEMEGVTCHRVGGLQFYGGNGGYPPQSNPLAAFSPLNLYDFAAFRAGVFSEMTTFSVRALIKLRRLLGRHRFDVIHDNQSLGWGLLPLKALGVPLLATIHHPLTVDRDRGFEAPTSFGRQWGKMKFYPLYMQGVVGRRMDHVVTVSRASAEAISADFRIPRERISVIHNGVDSQRFRPLRGVARVPGRVLFVGNIEDPNKGGVYLLRAMALLPPPAHLVIVTGGITQREWFEGLLSELRIRERVSVVYRLSGERLVEMYATAQVAVSPSVFEGFGFPAAEAMACGLPLVAARGGALPEVVGDAGLLVPTRDPEALAGACGRLLGDAALRVKLGRAARRRVRAKFRWSRAAEQLTAVYERLLGQRARVGQGSNT
ncbi:MAG: glycosyltransferase family 4 protein [SAR324 cluster bacterium]|nr:glycosyltransferase family 4 protein [SAR324 cluster bacterium]